MEFDELQSAWQNQSGSGQVKVESDALLKMVRRNHQAMERSYFVHDRILAFVFGLIYVPAWIWLGITRDLPWTWYLEIPAFLLVAGFLIMNRMKQRRIQPRPGESLRTSVEHSLAKVDHQIRLQKNVFWWYLLPPWVPMAAFFIHTGLLVRNPWGAAHNVIVSGLIFWGVYELFQWGVRKNLLPRREELVEFLESLESESE
ncbi:MAG: hypothetical protein P1V20_12250 [Verrucomicrobiales bacterium]|nr:hypothetical protein [Verrucomicrobiales bacterium]